MTQHAKGTFEVRFEPQSLGDREADAALARVALSKQFHGGLEAISRGEMLSATSAVDGSAGYVAIEQVTGSLDGHRGTFILQHSGVLTRGEAKLTVIVVPDSGTDGLVGLTGQMSIEVVEGRHSYDLEYDRT
ncbi:MAG: DUF3224 domain-containing protein [Thermoplasmata archaeon]|nr:DUF3224 domain-containing protein [Thermoplasmata archaeon]